MCLARLLLCEALHGRNSLWAKPAATPLAESRQRERELELRFSTTENEYAEKTFLFLHCIHQKRFYSILNHYKKNGLS